MSVEDNNAVVVRFREVFPDLNRQCAKTSK